MGANRWIILATLFGARASVGYQYQAVASTSPLLRAEFGVALDAIGVLIGLYFATGMFLSLPAAAIGARFGSRACVLFGLALMVFGSAAAAYAPTWSMHVAARVVAGAGGVFVTVFMTNMKRDLPTYSLTYAEYVPGGTVKPQPARTTLEVSAPLMDGNTPIHCEVKVIPTV